MKIIKTLFVSLLVILTIALTLSFNFKSQIYSIYSYDNGGIDTHPLPYSLRLPNQSK